MSIFAKNQKLNRYPFLNFPYQVHFFKKMLIKNLKGYEAFEHLIGKDLNIYKEFK